MERVPTRAFSWLKAAATAFTFKALLRHYAIQQPLDMTLVWVIIAKIIRDGQVG